MKVFSKLIVAFLSVAAVLSCESTRLEERLNSLETRIGSLEKAVGQANENAEALRKLKDEKIWIEKYETRYNDKSVPVGYVLSLSDGSTVEVVYGLEVETIIPIIAIDSENKWIMSIDGGKTFTRIEGASDATSVIGKSPRVRVDAAGYWQVSTDWGDTWKPLLGADGKPLYALSAPSSSGAGGSVFKSVSFNSETQKMTFVLIDDQTFDVSVELNFRFLVPEYKPGYGVFMGSENVFTVEAKDVAEVMIQAPDGWDVVLDDTKLTIKTPQTGVEGGYKIAFVIVSNSGLLKHFEMGLQLKEMIAGLLDFSFAGYDHGESAPLPADAWGYKVYNVLDYGAVPNDGESDRDAFLKCLTAALGVESEVNQNNIICFKDKAKANAIVYFPEGEYILHTSADDVPTAAAGLSASQTIQIRSGNFILRGAGRDKTILIMQDPNQPSNPSVLYSSPAMIELKHNSGLSKITDVTADAAKGSFSVEVASTTGLAEGNWVCLSVVNNDPAFVKNELKDGNPTDSELSRMTNIKDVGVQVYDYHQIKSISGNTVTFYEPLMHEVELKYTANTNSKGYNWRLDKYPHYENVGVEDLTFRGNAKEHFKHHGSWEDDGAYKPINLVRLTNSWIRRVGFESVSEACSITSCSNVSAYDIRFSGRRGHASVRSQASSRVFIGSCTDTASGDLIDNPSTHSEMAGQYHAVGVSKQSMGTVLWRNVWGNDSCFESHATQPRATLIDCCKGGWMKFRQGGDESQVPNHLADLTIWNFESTTSQSGLFGFWDHSSRWWKFLPPVIVGFHGRFVTFDESQVKTLVSNGSPFPIESLYERQLRERLGSVPAWLGELK